MKNKTLLNPEEIKEYSGMKMSAPICDLRNIFSVENYEARNRFGYEFYLDLIAGLADYSASAEWTTGVYVAEDVVIYRGIYYQAKENTSQPPTDKTKWRTAPKFVQTGCGEKWEELFCNYLGPYLASAVLANRLPFIHSSISGGVIEYKGENFNPVTEAVYTRVSTAIQRDKDLAWSNMSHWLALDENYEDTCFEKFKDRHETDCNRTATGTRQHRSGLYDFG